MSGTLLARRFAGPLGALLTGLTLSATAIPAQEAPDEADRPTVGLVLSGGGARGFAHVGVLRVLHEMRIPVDVIAGTSMGAVIGGIYATGLSYPDLERLVRDEDWSRIFEDDPPRRTLPMRRKRLDREIPIGPEFGVDALGLGLRLPPALMSGAKLTNALQAYTYRASGLESFDELPIPFRAVATDIEDGSVVVLDRGNLGDAIRASMAVPGAFSAQPIGDRLLVDGGIARNVPVDVARGMGADVVIVSDVTTSLDEAPEPDSPVAVAQRLFVILTSGPTVDQLDRLGADDVYVRADLEGISTLDFARFDSVMTMGEVAARAVADRLRPLAVSEADFRALTARRAAELRNPGVIRVDTVAVDGTFTRLSPRVVEGVLGVEPGDTLSPTALRERLTGVVGYGGFQDASFRLTTVGARQVLEVRPTDKSWGPLFARPALSLTDQQRGTGAWSLRAYLEWTRLNAGGGQAWAELEIGTRHGMKLWTQLPLEAGHRVFLFGSAQVGRQEVFPEISGLPVGLDLADRELFAGVGFSLGSWGDLIFGGGTRWNRLFVGSDVENVEDEAWDERSLEARLDIDVLDRVDFPSSGVRLRAEWVRADSVLGATVSFEQLLVDALVAVSSGHLTVTASALMSSGLGTEVPFYRSPTIGGLNRLTGLERDATRGGYAAVGRASVGWRLDAGAGAAGGGVRIGFSVEAGQAQTTGVGWQWPPENMMGGGSLWVGVGTPVGPVTAAFGGVRGRAPEWVIQVGAER